MKLIEKLDSLSRWISDNLFPPSAAIKEYEARAKLAREFDDDIKRRLK